MICVFHERANKQILSFREHLFTTTTTSFPPFSYTSLSWSVSSIVFIRLFTQDGLINFHYILTFLMANERGLHGCMLEHRKTIFKNQPRGRRAHDSFEKFPRLRLHGLGRNSRIYAMFNILRQRFVIYKKRRFFPFFFQHLIIINNCSLQICIKYWINSK